MERLWKGLERRTAQSGRGLLNDTADRLCPIMV